MGLRILAGHHHHRKFCDTLLLAHSLTILYCFNHSIVSYFAILTTWANFFTWKYIVAWWRRSIFQCSSFSPLCHKSLNKHIQFSCWPSCYLMSLRYWSLYWKNDQDLTWHYDLIYFGLVFHLWDLSSQVSLITSQYQDVGILLSPKKSLILFKYLPSLAFQSIHNHILGNAGHKANRQSSKETNEH